MDFAPILAQASLGQLFEAGMLTCFAASWPVAIFRTWRSKRTEGKSLGFMALVMLGYVSGIIGKLVRANAEGASPEPVTILYLACGLLVMTDLLLVLHYRRRKI